MQSYWDISYVNPIHAKVFVQEENCLNYVYQLSQVIFVKKTKHETTANVYIANDAFLYSKFTYCCQNLLEVVSSLNMKNTSASWLFLIPPDKS